MSHMPAQNGGRVDFVVPVVGKLHRYTPFPNFLVPYFLLSVVQLFPFRLTGLATYFPSVAAVSAGA